MIVVVQDAGMESDDNKPFYEDDEEEEEVEKSKKPVYKLLLDQDHKLLLRNAKPLLQSRNASVSYQNQHFKYISILIVSFFRCPYGFCVK